MGLSTAWAERLPAPDVVEKQTGVRPAALTVVEPHLSTPDKSVEVAYLAFPAPLVLSAALGRNWAAKAKAIEFRALDGYVSRVDVARLESGKAYLAFARADGSRFTVDNLAQNQKNVPLGPYYLVWDNRADAALLSEGDSNWPYQVIDASVSNASDAALRPPGFDPALERGLSNVKAHCLNCHKVNGYGGEKAGGNLALIARGLTAADFLKWVLEPSSVSGNATMPTLTPGLPDADRRAIAESIYDYLSHVQTLPDP